MISISFAKGKTYQAEIKAHTATISLPVRLTRPDAEDVTIDILAAGGKGPNETFGMGPNFSGSTTWEHEDFEQNRTTLTIPAGQISASCTITIVNNGFLEDIRYLKFTLTNPSANARIASIGNTIAVRVADLTLTQKINVTVPGVCAVCGASFAAYAHVSDGVTNNQAMHLGIVEHFRINHPGSRLIFYYPPPGSYAFGTGETGAGGRAIDVPTSVIDFLFTGPSNPVDSPTAPQAEISFLPSIATYDPDVESRCFSSQRPFGMGTDEPVDREIFAVRNLKFKGNAFSSYYNTNRISGYQPYEHNFLFDITASNPPPIGLGIIAIEAVRIEETISDGVHIWGNDSRLYHVQGYDVFRGLVTITGGSHKANLKDVKGYNTYPIIATRGSIEAGADHFDVEDPTGIIPGTLLFTGAPLDGLHVVESVIGNTVKFTAPVAQSTTNGLVTNSYAVHVSGFDQETTAEGANSTVVMDGCDFPYKFNTSFFGTVENPSLWNVSNLNVLAAKQTAVWPDGITIMGDVCDGNFTNVVLEGRTRFRIDTGVWVLTDCTFRRIYMPGVAVDEAARALAPIHIEKIGASVTFSGCTFASKFAKHSTIPTFGFGNYPSTDNDKVIILNNCTFDASLDGGIMGSLDASPAAGDLRKVLTNCIFNNVPRDIGGGVYVGAAMWLTAYEPSRFDISFDGCQFNTWKFAHFYVYGTPPAVSSYVRFRNTSLDKANNNMTIQTGHVLTQIRFVGMDAKHPTGMTSANPCVVTSTGHGFQNGDKVFWSAVTQVGWYEALCQSANVPVFTVQNVTADTFELAGLDTSGLSAYDAGTDQGLVSKYPLRTITGGAAAENPNTSQIAGFAGDRFVAADANWRCNKSGVNGVATWVLE